MTPNLQVAAYLRSVASGRPAPRPEPVLATQQRMGLGAPLTPRQAQSRLATLYLSYVAPSLREDSLALPSLSAPRTPDVQPTTAPVLCPQPEPAT